MVLTATSVDVAEREKRGGEVFRIIAYFHVLLTEGRNGR
jgi:hypothetical protein